MQLRNLKEMSNTAKANLKKSNYNTELQRAELENDEKATERFKHKPYQCDVKLKQQTNLLE